MKFFVYILYRPDGRPFWVGKGSGKRLNGTVDPKRTTNRAKAGILRRIIARDQKVDCRVVARFDDERSAFDFELLLIKQIGRSPNGPLVNLTDGGEGPTGQTYTPERNAKVSAGLQGRPKSPEHRAKLARATKRYLKEHPAELERLRQQASLGGSRVQSEEERAKRRRPREMTPQHIANIRAAAERRPSRKGIPKSQETREKMSEGATARWARDRTPRTAKGPDGKFIKKSLLPGSCDLPDGDPGLFR